MPEKTEQEKLITELYDIVNKHLRHMGAVQTISLPIMISEIEDVILKDRARIVAPLVESIKREGIYMDTSTEEAIKETLKLAGVDQ